MADGIATVERANEEGVQFAILFDDRFVDFLKWFIALVSASAFAGANEVFLLIIAELSILYFGMEIWNVGRTICGNSDHHPLNYMLVLFASIIFGLINFLCFGSHIKWLVILTFPLVVIAAMASSKVLHALKKIKEFVCGTLTTASSKFLHALNKVKEMIHDTYGMFRASCSKLRSSPSGNGTSLNQNSANPKVSLGHDSFCEMV